MDNEPPAKRLKMKSDVPYPSSERNNVDSGVIALTYCEEDNSDGDDQNKSIADDLAAYEGDDDCDISPPPPESLEREEKDEKNLDEINVADACGRILINVAHPEEDPDIFLAPQVARIAKPHQIGGIRFLYDKIVESLDRFNTTGGFGCILAHSMGLGKTLQAVSFCDIFLRYTCAKTILVIVPVNTIQNWMNEFDNWVPSIKTSYLPQNELKEKSKKSKSYSGPNVSKKLSATKKIKNKAGIAMNEESSSQYLNNNTNSSSDVVNEVDAVKPFAEDMERVESEDTNDFRPRNFDVFVLNETVKTLQAREKVVLEWTGKGGVLLIGYEMYRLLASKNLKKSGRKNNSSLNNNMNFNGRMIEEESLNNIYCNLVNPGPDLVICDEGHRIKNSGASISQALKAIKTKRRVVLTGYPLQNNVMEYWCMVDFVRPNSLGSKVEFSNMFERPIQNGQCADSTDDDKGIMRFRSHILHSLLEGFVQRRSHIVLQSELPQKEEWVFFLKMTPIQYTLYRKFLNYLDVGLEAQNASANPIKTFAVCSKIWNHPDALYNEVKKKQGVLNDLDLHEVNTGRSNLKVKGSKRSVVNSSNCGNEFLTGNYEVAAAAAASSARASATVSRVVETPSLSLDWAISVFENYVPEVMENGVKFQFLFEILKETVAIKDKILVFSQSLLTLDLMEVFLGQKFKWCKNHEYYRLDGSTTGLEREKLIKEFNSKASVYVFLLSTRAGSLGINLIGANRVIIFDASWNPCHDSQAVCRVYRYGQTKQCQIYRFVTDATLEKRIYDCQISKRGMADRVVDEMNPDTPFKSKDVNSSLVLQHQLLDRCQYSKLDLHSDKYSDVVMRNVLGNVGSMLTQEPLEHESLLIDQKNLKLSAGEKYLARLDY